MITGSPVGHSIVGTMGFGVSPITVLLEVAIAIGGEDFSEAYMDGSFRMSKDLSGRHTASFRLFREDGAIDIDEGAKVTIDYAGMRIYCGVVDALDDDFELAPDLFSPANRRIAVSCTDHGAKAQRRIVAAAYEPPGAVAGVTNATPIVVTTASGHLLRTGDRVEVSGVGGTTAANGVWTVTALSTTTFELDGSIGDGAYTTGGTVRFMIGAIVRRLWDDILEKEEILLGVIADGVALERVIFEYDTVADALQQLARIAGISWWVDQWGRLQFLERSALAAPWSIDAANAAHIRFRIRRERGRYRNRQYIRAGQARADADRIETFAGDGETTTFVVAFPIAEAPKIETNTASAGYVTQSVGVRGQDDDALDPAAGGKAWFWSPRENTVSQNRHASVNELASGDKLRVTYRGLSALVVLEEDTVEILARQAAEGGTGVYEDVEEDTRIESLAFAQDYAQSFLRRYGEFPTELQIETDALGVDVGQLQMISVPAHEVEGSFLVERITAADRGDGLLRWTYSAVDGEALGGFLEFFRRLASQGTKFAVREAQVLIQLLEHADTVEIADLLTLTGSFVLSDWEDDPYTVFQAGAGVVGKTPIGIPSFYP